MTLVDSEAPIQQRARSQSSPRMGIDFLWLEITQHCNLRCRHCYTTSSPSKSHNEIDWFSLARQAFDLGCRQIQFIGGEPLSHPKILEYIRGVDGLGYDFIEVFTNLSLLSEKACNVFEKHGVNVATSFYSTRSDVHDKVTGVPGSFLQTVEGIKKVVERRLAFRVGLISLESDDEPTDRKVEFLQEMGVERDNIRIDQVRPVGRGAKMTPYVSRKNTLCGACWDGKLAISYDGNCYPCVFSRDVTVGNIRQHGVAEVVASRALLEFRESYFEEIQGSVVTDCGPDCLPSGPCQPNCNPKCSPPCNPNECVPVRGHCGPNNGTCVPIRGCGPGKCFPTS
jgi:MoaA/NifB/PqqE/SkfB family radical SAM enzyme